MNKEFEDLLKENLLVYNDEPNTPKMTKDEFIEKTRLMLNLIIDEYGMHWKNKIDENNESEENTCGRCNGFLYIEQGGVGDVDCPSCDGTGKSNERIFDADGFIDFMEHTVMFGEQPFLELINCEIID